MYLRLKNVDISGAQVGGFFAPILTPYIASHFGWSWPLYTGSLASMSGVIAIYLAKVRPATKKAEAPVVP